MSCPLGAPIHMYRGAGEHIYADSRRAILKRFFPSKIAIAERMVKHVVGSSESDAARILRETVFLFEDRHANLNTKLAHRFNEVKNTIVNDKDSAESTKEALDSLSESKQLLIGSLFLHEYAIEASALFNPSMVPHPECPEAKPGESQRVIVALRSCGEQHISSISFRAGRITPDYRVILEPNEVRNLETGETRRCAACDWDSAASPKIGTATHRNPVTGHEYALSDGVYTVAFDPATPMAARVLFPQTPEQSNGIEDVRFVRFVDDDGQGTYYGTLTAYDGKKITPQLVETKDFRVFTLHILAGDIHNKGMAIFPRKINGKYWTLSRQDDVSIFVMKSDNILHWEDKVKVVEPEEPWEWFKMGNCGSPLETKYGWLVLTHGVGPLRRYAMGVVMLDLNDPTKVIGRLKCPILVPNEAEREGYVPNVVYSCGGMVRDGVLVLPYAVSDSSSTFAHVKVDEIAAAMGLCTKEA